MIPAVQMDTGQLVFYGQFEMIVQDDTGMVF